MYMKERDTSPEGSEFKPGTRLDPDGEISLSYMDRLMKDCFSPTFFQAFWSDHKNSIKHGIFKLRKFCSLGNCDLSI